MAKNESNSSLEGGGPPKSPRDTAGGDGVMMALHAAASSKDTFGDGLPPMTEISEGLRCMPSVEETASRGMMERPLCAVSTCFG